MLCYQALETVIQTNSVLKHVIVLALFLCRGSLLTRSLADIVKKEDFVLDSEYLVTLLVIVPK